MPASALGTWEGPKPQKPQSLLAWIRSQGGIKDKNYMSGDLKAVMGKSNAMPGLLNNQSGKGLDDIVAAAYHEGFDVDPDDANSLMRLIQEEAAGNPSYRIGAREEWDIYQEYLAAKRGDRSPEKLGFGFGGKSLPMDEASAKNPGGVGPRGSSADTAASTNSGAFRSTPEGDSQIIGANRLKPQVRQAYQQAIEQAQRDYDFVGLRTVDGDHSPTYPSRNYTSNGEPEEVLLPGVSVTDAKHPNLWAAHNFSDEQIWPDGKYSGDRTYVIGGHYAISGDDAGELIIADPVVIFGPAETQSSKLLAGVSGLTGLGVISAGATLPKEDMNKKKAPAN
jgi:hypothetical protein